MNFPISINPNVLKPFESIKKKKNLDKLIVRVGVRGGGCSGLEYVCKIDNQSKESDYSYFYQDIQFICDPKSAEFLSGSELFWDSSLLGGGFKFKNPNAKRSCGCGTSFTPK